MYKYFSQENVRFIYCENFIDKISNLMQEKEEC